MAIDPAHLNRPNAPGRVTRVPNESERTCSSCGYPLRGIALAGRCPECGEAIRRTPRESDRPLSQMPVELIRRFRSATLLITLALFVLIVFAFVPSGTFLPFIPPLVTVAACATWITGIWLMTRPVPGDVGVFYQLHDGSRLRRAAFWLQFVWGATVIDDVITLVAGGASVPYWIGTDTLFETAGSIAGLVALGFFLAYARRVADFARDDEAGRAFELTLYGVPITYVIGLVLTLVPIPFVGCFVSLVQVGCILALPWGLFQLTRSMNWSVTHHQEFVEREARRAARAATTDAEIDRRLGRMD